jgi:hypothetical protein
MSRNIYQPTIYICTTYVIAIAMFRTVLIHLYYNATNWNCPSINIVTIAYRLIITIAIIICIKIGISVSN